jgi:hypothetical protein
VATYTRPLIVSFGPDYGGLVGKVTLTVFDVAGDAVYGPATTGIAESASSPGTYLAAPPLDSRWAGRVEWTIAGLPGMGAVDDYGSGVGALRPVVASFGAEYAGLVGRVGVTIYDSGGAVLAPSTTAGIAESAALPGTYYGAVFIDATWCGRIEWSIADHPGITASEEFGLGVAGAPFPAVTAPERPDPPAQRP